MIVRQPIKLGIQISSFFSDTLRLSKKLALYILLAIYLTLDYIIFHFYYLTILLPLRIDYLLSEHGFEGRISYIIYFIMILQSPFYHMMSKFIIRYLL